jgi:Na+/melibiose symporter-like transporter
MGLGYIVQPVALAISGKLKGGEHSGFLLTAIIFSALGFLMMQPAPFAMKERISPGYKKAGPLHAFKIMWQNKPFRQIIISGVLGSPKMLIMLVALPLMTYYFAEQSFWKVAVYMGLIGIPLFVGQYIAIGITPKLLQRISKKKLYNYSNLFAVIPSLLIFVLYKRSPMHMTSPVNIGLLALCFVFVGIGIGIPVVLMSIMIADCVDYQEYMTGERPDGVFFAGQSFIAKLQAAVATFIAGVGYTHVGFSDKAIEKVNAFIAAGGAPRTNPEFQPYLMILFFLIAVPAAAGYFLTVLPMRNYALDTPEHNRIIAELNQRRQGAQEAE